MQNDIFKRMIELGVEPFDLRQPIYKYRTFESAKDILKSNQVYFPNSVELKDKLELHTSLLDLNFTQQEKENYCKGFFKRENGRFYVCSDEEYLRILQSSIEFFKTQIGIFSTSKTATCSSLWDHYGGSGKGICLGFVIPPNASGTFLSFNINYKHPPIKVKLIDEEEGDISNDIFYWFCKKDPSYSNEEEVRLINNLGYGLTHFQKDMLFEIIFGIDTTESDCKEVYELIAEYGYPTPRYGKIKIDDNAFGLAVEYFNDEFH
jgi:hypothetical protein